MSYGVDAGSLTMRVITMQMKKPMFDDVENSQSPTDAARSTGSVTASAIALSTASLTTTSIRSWLRLGLGLGLGLGSGFRYS